MKILSLAHECVPEYDKNKHQFFYRGASPDEVTLSEFARDSGFINTVSTETKSVL